MPTGRLLIAAQSVAAYDADAGKNVMLVAADAVVANEALLAVSALSAYDELNAYDDDTGVKVMLVAADAVVANEALFAVSVV